MLERGVFAIFRRNGHLHYVNDYRKTYGDFTPLPPRINIKVTENVSNLFDIMLTTNTQL